MYNMLPIGSVVELEGVNDFVVVIGLLPTFVDEKEITIYEYVGCNYLKGYTSAADYIFFDDSNIKNVYFIGYAIDFDFKFLKILHEIYKELGTGKNINDALEAVCKKVKPDNPQELIDLKNKIADYYFNSESTKEQGV